MVMKGFQIVWVGNSVMITKVAEICEQLLPIQP